MDYIIKSCDLQKVKIAGGDLCLCKQVNVWHCKSKCMGITNKMYDHYKPKCMGTTNEMYGNYK